MPTPTNATDGMTIWKYIKMNPLLSAAIVAVLCIALYFAFNTLYAAGQILVLNHANKQLEKANEGLLEKVTTLDTAVADRDGLIEHQAQELTEKDALLQATAKQTVASKTKLDDATATAGRIMGDTSVLTREQLKTKLCELYPTEPACR